ncbi:MAG TPA: transcription antitermination factor NusB, partial [Acidimicrobiales bacterium]|nr:transcription antitermination factor NusB [Acidimicrobiales bacterium]
DSGVGAASAAGSSGSLSDPGTTPAGRSARDLAIRALVEVERGSRANVVVPELLRTSGLAERDRAFVTELVYGTVRMRRACDWLVERHVHRRLDPEVRCALRLGAYQLAWLATPPHAAVDATVSAVEGPARGLVNAVLRRVATDVQAGPPAWPDDATRLSYPDWIVEQLSADLGVEAALATLVQMNEPAAVTLRPDGYVQDLASQWVGAAAGAGPGQRVADLCAAPGGKSTWMAYGPGGPHGQHHPDDRDGPEDQDRPGASGLVDTGRPALVVAADIDAGRAGLTAANAARLSLANVATVVADARRPPLRPGGFDRVLVDAPCSGLGVLRRRPDARWRVQRGDLPRLAALQRQLLDAALPLVAPGGRLVYSVCTFTLAETAGIDRWLAVQHPHARAVLPPGAPWERVGRGARLLPQAAGTDGMFLLVLEVGAERL